MNSFRSKVILIIALALSFQILFEDRSGAQGQVANPGKEEAAQLKLRKTLKTREYQGRQVEGEERVVSPGDSLWKFLVQEKGLPEKQFGRYVVIIGALNPQLKRPEALQVGEVVFIPLRPDEVLGIKVPVGDKSETKIYRVKAGDYLYQILRNQLGIKDGADMASTFRRVKDMNPRKKNWNVLFVGEAIALPGRARAPDLAAAETKKASPEVAERDRGDRLSLQENLPLLEQIMAALGNETYRTGVEILSLQEGVVRIDRESFPVVENPKIAHKVILDLKGQMPPTLKSKLEKENSATRVVSAKQETSLHEAVSSLLSRLGFQSLPPNRPVAIQDAGVGVLVKGEWMFASPEGSGNHEMLVISLVAPSAQTPDYLKDYLSAKGVSLREISLPQSSSSMNSPGAKEPAKWSPMEAWPVEKSVLVDAFLELCGISFSANSQVSLPLREGISMDVQIDRLLQFGGKKIALLFRPVGGEVKRALETMEGLRPIELDLKATSSRALISSLLESIGEPTTYRQHRFSADEGRAKDKLVLTVSGFFLPQRSLLLTDGEIPKALETFFSAKGLRVVYFR